MNSGHDLFREKRVGDLISYPHFSFFVTFLDIRESWGLNG